MLTNTSAKVRLCACRKANGSVMERIPKGSLVRTLFFWLPLKKYRCFKCMRNRWVLE